MDRRGELQKSLEKLSKKCEIEEEIDEIKIYMPNSQQSNKVALELLNNNVAKMNKFFSSIVNPASLAKLIIELNAVKIKDVQIGEPVETEDSKMMTFKNSKRSNASAGDILNLKSFKDKPNLNETLD